MSRWLVACEESQILANALNARGHDAWSCDLLPRPGKHITGNVLDHLDEGWDAMVAFPPCTRLTNSGVCWLHSRNLWSELNDAAYLFRHLLGKDPWTLARHIPFIAVENPIPHKYALERIGHKYDQIIQPYQFGHPERKATCLWLKNLPILRTTEVVELPKDKSKAQRIHYLPPSPDRAMLRSKTFSGIAEAMADQWGEFVATANAPLEQRSEIWDNKQRMAFADHVYAASEPADHGEQCYKCGKDSWTCEHYNDREPGSLCDEETDASRNA